MQPHRMPGPIFLLAKSSALIEEVRRTAARGGFECLVATSGAEAMQSLAEAESSELLMIAPDAADEATRSIAEYVRVRLDLTHENVVVLGPAVPGAPWESVGLPIDPALLAVTIERLRKFAQPAGPPKLRQSIVTVRPLMPSLPPARPPPQATTPNLGELAPPSSGHATPARRGSGVRSRPSDPALNPPASASDGPQKVRPIAGPTPPRERSPTAPSKGARSSTSGLRAAPLPTPAQQRRPTPPPRQPPVALGDAPTNGARAYPAPTPDRPISPPREHSSSNSGIRLVPEAMQLTRRTPTPPRSQLRAAATPPPLPSASVAAAQRQEAAELLRVQIIQLREALEHVQSTNAALIAERTQLQASVAEAHAKLEGTARAAPQVPPVGVNDPTFEAERAARVAAEAQSEALASQSGELSLKLETSLAAQAGLEARFDELSRAYDAERERRAEASRSFAMRATENANASAQKLADLENQLRAADAAAATHATEKSKLVEQVADLETKVRELTIAGDTARGMAEESLRAQRATFERQLVEATRNHESSVAQVTVRLNDASEKLEMLTAKHRDAAKNHAAAVARLHQSLREAIAERDAAINREAAARRDAAAQLEAVGDHGATAAELARLKNDVREATSTNLILATQMRETSIAHQTEVARLVENLAAVTARETDLRAQIKVAEVERRSSQSPLIVADRKLGNFLRSGRVELAELTRLVGTLARERADAQLDLVAPGEARSLWLQRGMLVAAESGVGRESLVNQARSDGIIDSAQQVELQILRGLPGPDELDALVARGFIQAEETTGLATRYVENVALAALSKTPCEYRMSDEPVAGLRTSPRPIISLLLAAQRRALNIEEVVRQLGGPSVVASRTEDGFDLLGLRDAERVFVRSLSTKTTIREAARNAGLSADSGYRWALLFTHLGLLTVEHAADDASEALPDLDRLTSKRRDADDADYFTLLGVDRSSSADDIARAHLALSREFSPLRYSGHADPAVRAMATEVSERIDEAARILADDWRRSEYARHLVDSVAPIERPGRIAVPWGNGA